MNRNLVHSVQRWILVGRDMPRVIKVGAVGCRKRMMLVFVAQAHGKDILISIWYRGGKGGVWNRALVELIPGTNDEIVAEAPITGNSNREGIPPILGNACVRQEKLVTPNV